ncbi:carboxypeptidase-like regulatory domain-containing protein [Spongiimicrobium sp. 3-5]|uniref:carboxypeptidase-like regulatory domain-containing protein n=1 Tax=Spongiimicrobium sp. 3-5 TaxID=3332596 RepID=UPI00397EFB2B
MISSCRTAEYSSKKFRSGSLSKIVVSGVVYDTSIDSVLPNAAIVIGDSVYWTGPNGRFICSLEEGNYKFSARHIGLEVITTEPFSLKKGDSLELNFRMRTDRTPLVD